ncbi:hypothetical protein PENANT_c024G09289 [Penicillium antarcticum]|uniref:Uncharacterized protein n=1 Tax=Penicillium antarcticum TaxID=416450 RepID=A0A1V6PY09_9EURO|nr:hypothetical protein PENANT_c024G09289 [Penicillium antarcticum]
MLVEDENLFARSATADENQKYEGEKNMTHVLMRLLKLISNAQTSFNRSTIADAFNASISDYLESIKNNATTNGMSDSQIILKDVENAMVSYIDDMLVAYASAQLKVAEFTTSVPTLLKRSIYEGEGRSLSLVIWVLAY